MVQPAALLTASEPRTCKRSPGLSAVTDRLQAVHHVETVDIGQAKVEQHDIRPPCPRQPQAFGAGFGLLDPQRPTAAEHLPQHITGCFFVIDQQNAARLSGLGHDRGSWPMPLRQARSGYTT